MLTQERLQEVLEYNPDTGIFVWKINKGSRARKGQIAGCADKKVGNKPVYIGIRIDGKLYDAQRLAFLYMNGEFPKLLVDHKNRNGLDNRWENLKEVTYSESNKNKSHPPLTLKSIQKMAKTLSEKPRTNIKSGIYPAKRKGAFQVKIDFQGKRHSVGIFENFEDALEARNNKWKELEVPNTLGI
jgi:hypothetical protein